MSKSNADKIEVYQHGKTYSEQETLDDKYPFQLCPECQSYETEVIKYEGEAWYQTGDTRYERKGIFRCQIVHVNHICKSCGCKWDHTYENKNARESVEVDPDLAYLIIALIVFALSLTACICGWIIFYQFDRGESPWYIDVWAIASTMVSIISFMCSAIEFSEI